MIYRYEAVTLDTVIDGDTYWFRIDVGFRFSTRQKIRLHLAKCPELSEPGGDAARAYAESLLTGYHAFLIESHGAASYDRWVCDIKVGGIGGKDLAALLIGAGVARKLPPFRTPAGAFDLINENNYGHP